MEKRGIAGQIDWIIGIGMFLLAIGFIFVLFRPGVTPVNSAEILLDVVDKNFMEESTWEVNKVPMFIEPVPYILTGSTATSGPNAIINKIILLSGDGDNTVVNLLELFESNYDSFSINENNIEVFYTKLNSADTEPVDNSNDDVEPAAGTSERTKKLIIKNSRGNAHLPKLADDSGHSIKFKLDERSNKQFYIKSKTLINEKTKNILVYSNELLNIDGGGIADSDIDIDYNRDPYKACPAAEFVNIPDTGSSADVCKAKYELGVAEKARGISLIKLDTLESEQLSSIINRWGFPENRDFKITISGEDLDNQPFNKKLDNTDKKDGLIFPDEAIIPDNVNVFARRFNNFILNDDGEKVPVTVTIQVW